jgi:hypothetical protein
MRDNRKAEPTIWLPLDRVHKVGAPGGLEMVPADLFIAA